MSNLYFKKLSIEFPFFPTNLKGDLVVEHLHPDGTGIAYFRLADTDLQKQILNFFKEYNLHGPVITYAEINADIWLHRDYNGTVVINYYIDTPIARTIFYRTSAEPYINNAYRPEDCTQVDSFVAESTSTWMLDVSQVHSVEMLNPGIRKFISVAFLTHSFGDLLSLLN